MLKVKNTSKTQVIVVPTVNGRIAVGPGDTYIMDSNRTAHQIVGIAQSTNTMDGVLIFPVQVAPVVAPVPTPLEEKVTAIKEAAKLEEPVIPAPPVKRTYFGRKSKEAVQEPIQGTPLDDTVISEPVPAPES